MQGKKKRLLVSILIICNIILLLVGGYRNLHTDTTITLQGSDLTNYAGYINEEQTGYFIDESIGYSGKCFYTEDLNLKRGIYRVTVAYQTDNEGNSITCSAGAGYQGFLSDTLKLSPNDGVASSKVWLKKNVDDFQVNWNYGGVGTLACNGVTITQLPNLSAQLYLMFVLALIDACVYLYYRNKEKKVPASSRQTVFVLGITALLASLPLTEPFLIEGHDLMFHLMRIEGIKEGLQSGQFPVFIQPNWLQGYGYDVSVFYSDFFLYLPALLNLLRVPIQDCYKIYLVTVNILTAVIAYQSVYKITRDRYAGYLGSVLYTLSVYRLLCIYKRAAIGEYTAMTVLPLLVYAFYRIFTEDTKTRRYRGFWLLPVIGFSVLMQSHLLSCEMVGIFVVLTCLILWKRTFRKETFIVLAKTVIVTVVINIGYLVPFLSYSRLDLCILHNWGGNSIQEHGINLVEALSPFYGGELSYGPGLVFLAGLGIFCYLRLSVSKGDRQKFNQCGLLAFVTGLGFLALFMSTNLFPYDGLMPLGKIYELLAKVQFPFRYLSVTIPFLTLTCVLTVLMIRQIKGNGIYKIIYVSMISLTVLSALYYYSSFSYKAQEQIVVYDESGLDTMYIEGHEYMYTDVDMDNFTPGTATADEGVLLTAYQKQYTNVNMSVENTLDTEAGVTLPMFLWPGVEAVDVSTGEQLQVEYADQMLLKVVLPAGYQGSIFVSYHISAGWRMAEGISVVCALGIVLVMIRRKCEKQM